MSTFRVTCSALADEGHKHSLTTMPILFKLSYEAHFMTNCDKFRDQKYLKLNISFDFSLKGKAFQ